MTPALLFLAGHFVSQDAPAQAPEVCSAALNPGPLMFDTSRRYFLVVAPPTSCQVERRNTPLTATFPLLKVTVKEQVASPHFTATAA